MRMTASWFGSLDLPHTRLRRDSIAPESGLPSDCHPNCIIVLEAARMRMARSNQETESGKNVSPCLTQKAPYKGLCADSGEKHEPASDIAIAVVDSLKALDPNVWTRRALQGKIVRLESVVSHQCIRPRIGADAPGHHGNPRTPELITGHASKGYLGSSVLGCAGKTICPSTLFSRRPGWEGQRGVYIGSLLVVSG